MTLYRKTMKKRYQVVNPVARAVARAKLHQTIVSQKIKLYLMNEGEDCGEVCEGIGMTLAVLGYAAEIDPKIGPHDSTVRILRGGLSACQSMLLTGKWAKINTVAIDVALDAAEVINQQVSPDCINKAWKALSAMEAAVQS